VISVPTLILFLNIGIFVFGVLLLTKIAPFHRRLDVRWLMLMTAALSLISFCSLNVYIQDSLGDKALFSRLRFIGLGVLGPSWFFFLIATYSPRRLFRKTWLSLLCLLPGLLTAIFAAVPAWGFLVTDRYELFRWQGASLVKFSNGPWFPVHIFTANVFAVAALVFILSALPRSSGVKRKQLLVLLAGSSISLLVDIYGVVTSSPLRWAMLSGGTFLITEAAIFFAIQRHGLLDLAPLAKNWIFREIPDPVVILDDQNRLLDFNTAAGAVFDLSPRDLGLAWAFAERETGPRLWNRLDANGGHSSYEVNVIDLDPRKTVAGRIMFFRDVSAQKEIETRLNGDLEFKARLLSVIAHDFSAIIQAQSFLSSHLHKEVQPELRPHVGALTDMSFASQDFMTNILRWARAQETQMIPVTRPFEIKTLIREVMNNLEGALLLKELRLSFQPPAEALVVSGDSVMIESVIRNLLTNAIRASRPASEISISLVLDGESLRILIKDEGTGMNPKQLKVLNRAEDESLTETGIRPDGFGIGLVIARKFVSLHRGCLEFDSKEGKGTLVTLTLPL
jgi:signal transduction histidine kinase